jgi:hypothetical protein
MGDQLRKIRFFPDFGRESPLWESFTDKYAMDPSDYGLSDELSRGLRELMSLWNTHFIDAPGSDFEWDSAENEQSYWTEGDRLLEQLRSEVDGIAIVLDERRGRPGSIAEATETTR